PPHAGFVLCTADAQKMPLTVIGRCQHFVFRRHSEEQIIGRLTHIAKAEKVAVDPEAMQLIARTAQGSMRDAVGLLDQLVPLASGPISLEGARSLLGSTLAQLAVEAETTEQIPPVPPAPPALRATPAPSAPPPQGGEELRPAVAVPVTGWSEVLEKLNRTVRAAYLDAQPEVDGSLLVLWFRYGFHHKKAQEQSAQLMPHVRAWLGDDVKIDFRLRENDAQKSAPRAASPEDDPFVREIVKRFDGRVTRVREVSE